MKEIAIPVCLILLSASVSTSWKHNVNGNTEETVYRLPKTLIPISYVLSLTIDPTETNFTGKVNVTFDVADNLTSQFSLHFDGDYITVKSIKLNNKINCTASSPNKETSISVVNCDGGASGKNNFLYIEYSAKYSTDGYGLVKMSYFDQKEDQILIKSVFEPIYARRALPCFDEPNLRANFSVEIKHPTEYSAISNSAIDEAVESSENTTTTKFDPTPKIPTYLLSFLISKLHKTDVKSANSYDFKIFTRAEKVNYTNIVQKYHDVVLDRVSVYAGAYYQHITVECYQVALPEYLGETGGFGLFKHREIDILDDGDATNLRAFQDIIRSFIYKLIHEWYGGYLTVTWWSDIWVNEAVSTYISYMVTDKVNDTFDIKNQFVAEVFRKSLQRDAYSFAQPLSSKESNVNNINDIMKKLDSDSSQKGASILRMISNMISGDTPMRNELAQHMFKRKESAINGSDLILDLTEHHSTTKNDLYSYLQTWIFSAGYPLLTVKIVNVTSQGVEVLGLSQKRFQYPTKDMEMDDTQWILPIDSASESDKQFYIKVDAYFTPNNTIPYYCGPSYKLFNVQSGFFYRVNYDEVLWNRIISSLKDETRRDIIFPLTRAQIVDDVFNIARTGDVSYSIAFQVADSLANETNYYTWYAAFDALSYLIGKTGDDVAEQNLKIYILDLLDKVLKESNEKAAENGAETHIDVLRRVLVTDWACKLNHTETVNNVIGQFNYFLSNSYRLEDYNLMGTVLCNGIRYSKDTKLDWLTLWSLYYVENRVHSKQYILNALGCTEDEELLNIYLLEIIKPSSSINEQDAIAVFKSVFQSSSAGISAAISFLDTYITKVVSLNKNVWTEILYTLAEHLFSNEHLEWFDNKLNDKIFDGFDDVKLKAKELASVNNYWINNFQMYVKEILLAKY